MSSKSQTLDDLNELQVDDEPSSTELRLLSLREDIDEIDRSLIALLESRLEVCRALGEIKKARGNSIRDEAREEVVLSQLLAQIQDEELHKVIPELYHIISRMCLNAQGEDDQAPHVLMRSDVDDDQERDLHPAMISSSGLMRRRQVRGLISRQFSRLRRRQVGGENLVRSTPLTPDQRAWLTRVGFAHRGLHDALKGISENSLPSFTAAIEAGYGIELDVYLTRDGIPVVFHDEEMGRMTGATGEVRDYHLQELKDLKLIPGGEPIPTLAEALSLIDGRVPVLVEVKNYGQPVGALEEAVGALIQTYRGPLCIQSFNPMTLKWFLKKHPRVIRGLIAYSFPVEEVQMPATTRFLLKNLLLAPVCKPHYIAYEHHDLARHRLRRLHRMRAKGTPVLVWTVRTQEEAHLAALRSDNMIFEGFYPPVPKESLPVIEKRNT